MLPSTTIRQSCRRRHYLRPSKIIEPGASFDRDKEQKRFEDLVKSIEKEDHEKVVMDHKKHPTATAFHWNIESLRLQNSTMKQATQNVARGKKRKKSYSHGHGVRGDGLTFTVDYCHVYQSNRKKALSSRLTQRAYELGLQAIERSSLKQANKRRRKHTGKHNAGRSSSRQRTMQAKTDNLKLLEVGTNEDCLRYHFCRFCALLLHLSLPLISLASFLPSVSEVPSAGLAQRLVPSLLRQVLARF
jgi:hypothetical protein